MFKAKPIILLLLGAVVCCLSILEQIRKDKAEKYASNVGTIRSPADGDKYPPVALGGAVFTFLDGYQGLQFLIDTTSFKLWVKDNKLYADALILSPDSAIIVRMTANEFQLSFNTKLTVLWFMDFSRLEIGLTSWYIRRGMAPQLNIDRPAIPFKER